MFTLRKRFEEAAAAALPPEGEQLAPWDGPAALIGVGSWKVPKKRIGAAPRPCFGAVVGGYFSYFLMRSVSVCSNALPSLPLAVISLTHSSGRLAVDFCQASSSDAGMT